MLQFAKLQHNSTYNNKSQTYRLNFQANRTFEKLSTHFRSANLFHPYRIHPSNSNKLFKFVVMAAKSRRLLLLHIWGDCHQTSNRCITDTCWREVWVRMSVCCLLYKNNNKNNICLRTYDSTVCLFIKCIHGRCFIARWLYTHHWMVLYIVLFTELRQ